MKLIHIGDIVGEAGMNMLKKSLPALRKQYQPDFVIVNGENASRGNGLNRDDADYIFSMGVDVITSGNHIWGLHGCESLLEDNARILRPANYGDAPGSGVYVLDSIRGSLAVISLQGLVGLENIDCPFKTMDRILKTLDADNIFVDFHAEATSEKIAMGYYLDGRVSAMVGTHTHVQTADCKILPRGTGYITDAGMCGPGGGVLGVDKDVIIQRFLTHRPNRFIPSNTPCILNGVFFELKDGKTISCESFTMAEDK